MPQRAQRRLGSGETTVENASVDMKDYVTIKPSNQQYDTLQVDIKALPFKSQNECTRLWLNGNEIRNVKSVDIAASAGGITVVTVEFYANVAGVVDDTGAGKG